MVTVAQVWAALAGIPDPELPVVSIVDLGLVTRLELEGDRCTIDLAPTFVGCPALPRIEAALAEAVSGLGLRPDVRRAAEPWTSARISDVGRGRLARAGIAPPEGGPGLVSLRKPVACPRCGSRDTRLDNAFGPTACRALRHCAVCREPFEQFKP